MIVSKNTLLADGAFFLACNLSPAFAQQPGNALLAPGLFLGLRHNANRQLNKSNSLP